MSTVAPHRRFVSVELPFCVSITLNSSSSPASQFCGLQGAERQMVEAFVPPSFIGPCLDEVATTTTAAKESPNPPEESSTTEGKQHEHTLGIAKASEYHPAEVFSGWRSLDFHAEAIHSHDNPHAAKAVSDDEKSEREQMLRESFPSFVPQLLLHGFYRNDVLVEVRRKRRVKRLRDPVSGRVLEEVYLPESDGGNQTSSTVVGVVSREVDIVRPADFCFSPFSKDTLAAAPALCSANLFPPAHFLAEKTPFEVDCKFSEQFLGKGSDHRNADANRGEKEEEEPLEKEICAMPTLTVMADDPNIPPPMLPAQRDLLCCLNGGDENNDCLEVRTVKNLLEARPIWSAKDLLDAILQSGFCPRGHINKKIISCLTYVIRNGPFNRLRVRIGFDPYASYATASLQRLAVKINRRSELGTFLRDISRVPYIADVMKEIEKIHKERSQVQEIADASPVPCLQYRPRSTLFEKLAQVVRDGRLYVAFQFIDLSNDSFLDNLLLNVPAATSMPLERRTARNGWISEVNYHRATVHISEALLNFIKDEVAPALENFKRNNSVAQTDTGRRSISSLSPTSNNSDDEEEDAVSVGSAAFTVFSSCGSSVE